MKLRKKTFDLTHGKGNFYLLAMKLKRFRDEVAKEFQTFFY